MGTLYSVAVPLGNLGDITFRAIEILKQVDCIACEDTRNTKILLNKYNISTKVIDCHKFNEKERCTVISQILDNNGSAAIVSDAGTPGICDPGCILEQKLLDNGHKIVPIPGACALTTFLSAVPRNNEFFSFVGFLPKTSLKRKEIFTNFSYINLLFYESPNRLISCLKDIYDLFGNEKKIAVGRELTKIYEEIKIDSVGNILSYYKNHPLKGEIVGLVFANEYIDFNQNEIIKDIISLKNQRFSDKDISKILSSLKNIPKNKVYDLCINLND